MKYILVQRVVQERSIEVEAENEEEALRKNDMGEFEDEFAYADFFDVDDGGPEFYVEKSFLD